MKRAVLVALLAGLLYSIFVIVEEYYRPYKKIVIRCDAGRKG